MERKNFLGGLFAMPVLVSLAKLADRDDRKKPKPPIKQACSNCRFYDKTCKRFPSFVPRLPSDWCGEYEPGKNPTL